MYARSSMIRNLYFDSSSSYQEEISTQKFGLGRSMDFDNININFEELLALPDDVDSPTISSIAQVTHDGSTEEVHQHQDLTTLGLEESKIEMGSNSPFILPPLSPDAIERMLVAAVQMLENEQFNEVSSDLRDRNAEIRMGTQDTLSTATSNLVIGETSSADDNDHTEALRPIKPPRRRLRRHNCSECGKSFTRKFDLQRHLSKSTVHTASVRRTQCPNCGQGFTRQDNLNVHMRMFHAGTPNVNTRG
ncbi:hypothetical protein SeMB42_g05462 [Synchytrium endobioticum]|uniref:C2H2-type domain-containing protein n=1 Tax=Synchytrium endobioticum TaxID=286115 RepID=A0A507CR98_9FUNG|nr:hypothetical protein SeMB42_g05462 [Synchytrium endobioticum]